MATLLLADHDNKMLAPSTGKALTAAREIGGNVDILVAGQGCRAVAEQARKLDGVRKVLIADAPQLAQLLAEEIAALIVPLMATYDALLAPATTMGKNVLARGADDGQECAAARGAAPRRGASLRYHRGEGAGYIRATGLCRERHRDGEDDRQEDRGHGQNLGICRCKRGREGADRGHHAAGGARAVQLRDQRHQPERAAGVDGRPDRDFGRAWHAVR